MFPRAISPFTFRFVHWVVRAQGLEPIKIDLKWTKFGATTLSIMARSLTTFSIMTLSIKGLYLTLSIIDTQQNNVLWTKQAHHTNTKLAQLIKAKMQFCLKSFLFLETLCYRQQQNYALGDCLGKHNLRL